MEENRRRKEISILKSGERPRLDGDIQDDSGVSAKAEL